MGVGSDGVAIARVRVVAWGRALTATAAAIAASLLPASTSHRFGLQVLAGLVWVPWAGAIALAATGRAPTWLPSTAAFGDLAVVFAGTLLLPDRADVAALVYALEVVAAVWSGGLRPSLPVALGAVGLPIVAGAVDTEASVDPLLLGVLAAVVAVVAAALEGAAAAQRRSDVRSSRLAGKSAAVLDQVADAIVFCDGHGRIVETNDAAALLVSMPSLDARGRPCHEVLALHIGERRLDCSQGCPLVDRRDGGADVWRPTVDGRRQPLLVSVAGVGEPPDVEIVHSLRDITRLKQADEAKTLFLATASHELKTPLTVIAGFAQTLLLRPEIGERDREYALEAIDKRAQELSRIVDRLLLSSRIEAGRVDVLTEPTAVVPLILERVTGLEQATARTIEVSVDVEPGVTVQADPDAVVTVVDHLLENAVKYSPGGGTIAVSIAAGPGTTVQFAVSDHGIGMDDVALEHCFDKFWQSQVGDRRRFGGTGIGLYIVASLVEAMGGTVTVESRLGEGSTFTVTLHGVSSTTPAPASVTAGERSMVREFMRQIGVGSDER